MTLPKYIKLYDVVKGTDNILMHLNPILDKYTVNGKEYQFTYEENSFENRLNQSFTCLIATGYNVISSNKQELIKLEFDSAILDYQYGTIQKKENYNPIRELNKSMCEELGTITDVLIENIGGL